MRNRPKTAKVMCSDCTYLFVELVYTYLYWHCKLEMAVHSALCCYKWHCHCGSNPRICCGSIYFFFLFFSLYPQVNWMCQPCSDWVWIKPAVYFCAYWETIFMTGFIFYFLSSLTVLFLSFFNISLASVSLRILSILEEKSAKMTVRFLLAMLNMRRGTVTL